MDGAFFADYYRRYTPRAPSWSFDNPLMGLPQTYGPRWRAVALADGYTRKEIREAARGRRRDAKICRMLAKISALPRPERAVPLHVEAMLQFAAYNEAPTQPTGDQFAFDSSLDPSDGLHFLPGGDPVK